VATVDTYDKCKNNSVYSASVLYVIITMSPRAATVSIINV